jgi:hypothetical protein
VQAYPDEKHFVLLSDVQGLREMLSQEEECENSFRQLLKRFRCGTSKKEILKRNPGIKTIQAALKAGKETCFPDLDRAIE